MAKNHGGSNWIPVAVAVVAVALFLGWLATRQPPQTAVVTEPGDTATAATSAEEPVDEADVTRLSGEQMSHSARLDDLVGQSVRMDSVTVAGGISEQLFWAELPSGDLYLVKLDSTVVASGETAPRSGVVNLVGRIQTKDAQRLNQWMESGVLENQDQREQAEFGLSYLEAVRVRPVGN